MTESFELQLNEKKDLAIWVISTQKLKLTSERWLKASVGSIWKNRRRGLAAEPWAAAFRKHQQEKIRTELKKEGHDKQGEQ